MLTLSLLVTAINSILGVRETQGTVKLINFVHMTGPSVEQVSNHRCVCLLLLKVEGFANDRMSFKF